MFLDREEGSWSTGSQQGGFSFEGLQPGSYDLSAVTADGRIGTVGPIRVVSGAATEDVVISVERGGYVLLRYKGPVDYATATIERDGVRLGSIGLRPGREQQFPVPVGEVTVRLSAYDLTTSTWPPSLVFQRESKVQVGLGEELEVFFEVED